MTLVLRRIWVYLKLTAILAVVAVILTVVVENRDNTANVWLFKTYDNLNVLWLILITAISSIVGWWGFLKVFGVIRELREVRRKAAEQRQIEEQRRLASELAERERRLDEKVKRSISEPGS